MAILRDRQNSDSKPVGFVELFFDLVFVFAITQLAHHLITHLSLVGAFQTLIMLLAVWWLWMGTSWATNWLNPDHISVRLMLFGLMGISLLMGAAIPEAFGERGLMFGIAYSGAKIARGLFVAITISRAGEGALGRSFFRVAIWAALSAPLWVAGGLASEEARLGCWAAAILIDYAGPTLGYPTPFMGRSQSSDWDIAGDHLAERCALFTIIALGEAIIVTGSTYADGAQTPAHLAALAIATVGSAAMWWIYFDVGAKRAAKKLEEARHPGLLARRAYIFLHVPIVAGIIAVAGADEKALGAPLDPATPAFLALSAGGTAIFLLGVMLFKQATAANRRLPASHIAGVAMTGVLGAAGAGLPMLVINALCVLILGCVGILERVLRSEPTPHADNPDIVVEIGG